MLLSRFRRPAPASGFSGARVAMPLLHQEGPSPGGVSPRWGPSPGGVPPRVGLPPLVRSLPKWGPSPGGIAPPGEVSPQVGSLPRWGLFLSGGPSPAGVWTCFLA